MVPVEQDEAQERGPLHEVQEHREGEDGALAGDEVVVLVVVVKLGRDGHHLLEHALAFLLPAGCTAGSVAVAVAVDRMNLIFLDFS